MHFLNKLSAIAAFSILFASQSRALDVHFLTSTCRNFEFSVEVNAADYQLADYATFYVANAANVDGDYANYRYTINSGGDIYQWNRIFNFNPIITGTPPGGTQWRIGLALNDQNGRLLTYAGAEQYEYIANPCESSTTTTTTTPARSSTSTIPASTSTSTTTPGLPATTNPIPGSNSSSLPPKPLNITAIAGGIVGAVALLVALGVFLCLRKRKASQKAAIQRQNGSGDVIEKGYVSHDPIHSINTLPRSGHDSNLSDFISKDESMSNRTSFVPPMSPRSSQWNTSNVGPMSPSSAPLSPTLSATSAPSRANNPLLNSNFGSWTAAPTNNVSQDNRFGDLPEPMSRR